MTETSVSLAPPAAVPPLPQLRPELEITKAAKSNAGEPMWTIYDPVQQRFFQIDHQTSQLLSVWRNDLRPDELQQLVHGKFGYVIDELQVDQLLIFLRNSNLTLENNDGDGHALFERATASRPSLLTKFVHNYLFFKIPLIRPQPALKAISPWLKPIYTWQAVVFIVLMGLFGLYLVSRQWPAFITTFNGVFSFEGAVYFTISLIFLKAAHELAHAFTAARYGVYVPNMGIAFMLMVPLLYTDVTDSWRLKDRRQRLLIGAAGVVVELALACIATLLWSFLPDGTARSIAFMVATTGWLMSLAFNLNPCMKFDGYYLLADLIGIDNLQPRAFALGRWRLRQVLFAPRLEPPEQLSRQMRNWLIFYAWATWIYRFILFTTIAVFVYYFCFKVLGIVLFLLEIWYLIALPVIREILQWRHTAAQSVSVIRATASVGAALVATLALVIPWSTRIEAPAVLEAADLIQTYPPRAAVVVSIDTQRGAALQANAPIVHLQDPAIENRIELTGIRLALVRMRLARTIADPDSLDNSSVLRHELNSLQAQLDGLKEQKSELIIRARVGGTILELDPHLHPGRWIAKTDRIALVSAQKRHVIKGYVSESSLHRLAPNAGGLFVPDDLTRPSIPVKLSKLSRSGARSIDVAELASTNGGQIAVRPDDKQRLIPLSAQYFAEMIPQDLDNPPRQTVRGIVELTGNPESFLSRAWRQVSTVLVRESGF